MKEREKRAEIVEFSLPRLVRQEKAVPELYSIPVQGREERSVDFSGAIITIANETRPVAQKAPEDKSAAGGRSLLDRMFEFDRISVWQLEQLCRGLGIVEKLVKRAYAVKNPFMRKLALAGAWSAALVFLEVWVLPIAAIQVAKEVVGIPVGIAKGVAGFFGAIYHGFEQSAAFILGEKERPIGMLKAWRREKPSRDELPANPLFRFARGGKTYDDYDEEEGTTYTKSVAEVVLSAVPTFIGAVIGKVAGTALSIIGLPVKVVYALARNLF